ncbi:MAG: 2-amino-4-hydroxy-6-hydroxymethyldihydropteridine diphosphokinase [Oscillospiraceae bacterium]|jgi:2-amino-4-hydroxy-6-hydroxymethyldihydropteridine diphosphokinase|nr:2-amino-4-hydroxy-6-hydroxymethyldihydropteridine diphosphokinase [Oscillospiraceae bacterium]
MSEAVIGLGSNQGDKNAQLLTAVQAISHLPSVKLTGISSIYESPAEDASEGGGEIYHNMAVKLETEMSPLALLGACLGIEAAMGRVRTVRNAARGIDLDVLLYEGVKSESFELSLPHPRLLKRAFVLLPLKELYPSGRAPGIFFEPYLKELDVSAVVKSERQIAQN